MKSLTALLAASTLLLSSLVTAHTHQESSFKATEINSSLIFLQGKGGNIALSKGEDGLLIIDDDYADMSPALKHQIEQYGGIEKLKYIVNTHWHGDHTGGNAALGHHADIVAHNNVRERLSSHQEVAFFKMKSGPQPKHALPSLTYPESMQMHFNNDTLTLVHYPNGHTDGDSVIFFEKANVVHMGDHLFYPMFPFVDLGSGGNVVSYAKNVAAVLEKINDNTVVIPGHGPLTDKKGLSDFHQMLIGTLAEVKAMKDKGHSLEQCQKKGLSSQWDAWKKGFINQDAWISFIYNSL